MLLIKKGITEFAQSGYQQGIASLLTYQGVIYSDLNKTDLAQKSIERSIQIYKGLKDYQGLASSHNIIGVILSRKSNYNDASDHFFKSLKYFETLSDTDGITNTYIKIGENYERSGDLGNALEYYMKGLNVAKDQPENDLVMLRSSNIPSVVKDMKDNFISMKKLQKIFDVNGKNNSFIEVRSLPDAIKDAVYSMDGDTAKTLNYTRYALNLLLKNHKSSIYEEFSLNIKDNNKQVNPDNLHKATELIDIAPLLSLKKQKSSLVNVINVSTGKPGLTTINPIQANGFLNPIATIGSPAYMSALNSAEKESIENLSINTFSWNGLNNLPTQLTGNYGTGISAAIPDAGNIQNTDITPINTIESNPLSQNSTPTSNNSVATVSQYQSAALISTLSLIGAPIPDDIYNRLFATYIGGNIGNSPNSSPTGKTPEAAQNPLLKNQNSLTGMPGNNADSRMSLSAITTVSSNKRLTETINIVNESIIKKSEVGNLEGLIEQSKKKGDFITATSLLEQQKTIQDSIIFLETELAKINIESLNNINTLNSKLQQLESLDPAPHNENNLPIYIAGILSFIVLIAGVSLTRTKLINKELAKREIKLRNANNVKNKLISVIAHDITGSLGFMPLSLGLCRDKSLPEEEKDALLYQLELNAVASFNTLQNMLDWAKEQIQGNKLNQQTININDTLLDVLQSINVAANYKNITVVNNVPGSMTAYADPDHIKFVLRNLLTNAVKYSNVNGLIGISATLTKDRSQIITSISDNGIGINKEKLAGIFEPSGNNNSRTDNGSGNGIGLSLCKEFVTENGGEIWVESVKNKGSVFHFSMKTNS